MPIRRSPLGIVSLVVVVGLLAIGSFSGDIWSPYYKIQTIDQRGTDSAGQEYAATLVIANGVPHQAILSIDVRLEQEPFYGTPYQRIPDNGVGDVLVVGAGNGSDVALALRNGATSVDAVEIDPRIRELGVRLHPQKPYDDPRVTTYIGDGRAFLHQTDTKYDLVIFALPDSLTLVAGSNQLRLESYLFTQEALEDVREHLKPGGAFAMYNYYREDWLIGRLAGTAEAAFGHAPCVDAYAGRSAVIVAGLTEADQACGAPGEGSTAVASVSGPPPVRDDRPFLYLKDPGIPTTFLVVIGLILLISLIAVRVVGGPLRRMAPYADLACLGAAFLLLETRAVTWSALLFGTTWIVNAIVFAGILVVVLLAVEVTRHMKKRPSRPVAFGFLGVHAARRVARADDVAALAADSGARGGGGAHRVRAGVRLEHRLRDALRHHRGRHRCVRGQPARRDARRLPGVPRAHRRLPGAARAGRPALRRRVPARPTRERGSARRLLRLTPQSGSLPA